MAKTCWAMARVFDLRLGRLLGEDQADGRAINLLGAVGRVVHLKREHRALGQFLGGAGAKTRAEIARGVSDEQAVADAVDRLLDLLARLGDVDDDVMHDRMIARPGLDRLHPFVLVEIGLDHDVLVRHAAFRRLGRDRDRLPWHREDGVGLADGPAVGEFPGGGQLLVVALAGSRRRSRRAASACLPRR